MHGCSFRRRGVDVSALFFAILQRGESNPASPPAHEEATAARHISEKVDGVKQIDGQDDARRSGSESPSKMDDVRLDDDDEDEDEEPEMSNPLAKAQEARKHRTCSKRNFGRFGGT